MVLAVDIARSLPRDVDAIGVPVATGGPVPRALKMSRRSLEGHGFEGKVGQTLLIPSSSGASLIAVGTGPADELDPAALRTAAAALARVAGQRTTLATTLADQSVVDSKTAAQMVVEGVAMAGYKYTELKSDKGTGGIERLTLVVPSAKVAAATAGASRAQVTAAAVFLARDLANTPPGYLTAANMAERAVEVAQAAGLGIEVYDNEQLAEMGCGGLLGVNRGSAEPARLVKLTYSPRRPKGHVALVGKGVMYDSGGISLKPSDGMHGVMKMDMTGAAVVLATLGAAAELGIGVKVTGYLCCTDNMPSGSAMKLGDVLTIRNGKTVEVLNTDAEGRLVMADGLSLAAEERPDAMLDIATLTGACVVALGEKMAGVMGTNDDWVGQVLSAASRSDELVWRLPLPSVYRTLLDSNVADMKNIGGPYGGALTAGLFLKEFTDGLPWAHLDIAGPMKIDADDGWLSKGATGFGVRLLIELLDGFTVPV
jgi:leucyl aminopeptidase